MNRSVLQLLRAAILIAAVSLGCCTRDGDQPTAPWSGPDTLAPPTALGLTQPLAVLLPGQSTQGTAEGVAYQSGGDHPFYGPGGVSQRVTWTSNNPSIATVDAAGKITAHSAGTATIVIQSVRAPSVTLTTTALVIPAPLHFAKIAGGGQTCALTTDGSAYCWGVIYTYTGDTTDPVHAGPARVTGNLSFRAIAVGGDAWWVDDPEHHDLPDAQATACGITTAGALYCWGFGYDQSVSPGSAPVPTNFPAPIPIGPSLTFDSVSVGLQSACAIATDHQTYCWGSRAYGLGDGNPQSTDPSAAVAEPIAVIGGLQFQSISVGDQACGLVADGTAYCWGQQPTPVPGDMKFSAIGSAGSVTCGLSLSHELYCWGQSFSVPELYAGSASPVHIGDDRHYTALSGHAGGYPPVLCALDTSGAAYCMGSGDPSPVPGGLTFKAISAGPTNCGIASGKVYCWGADWNGALGAISKPADGSPALVAGQQP